MSICQRKHSKVRRRLKIALAAVGALVFAGQQRGGQQVAEVFLELGQGGLAQGVGGAAAQGGQAGTEGGEEGCVHRAVYIPPLLTHLLRFRT